MNNTKSTQLNKTTLNNQEKKIKSNPYSKNYGKVKLRTDATQDSLRVLTLEQWEFWKDQGYVLIKNAVSRAQAQKTASFLWEFEDKDPNDPKTWYTAPRAEIEMKELAGTGMVEAYNHQLLWNNRQTQKVYDAFVDVWGTQKLWVTIDRGNLNFPIRPGYQYKSFIHWDLDPEIKLQNVQGVLALNDQTDKNMGGFQCIPWLYKHYDTWKLTQPKDAHFFKPDITGLKDKMVKVRMETGDLLIFNSTQPHGIRPNHSQGKVRIAQYISMAPAQEDNQDLREWRINSWKHRIAPKGYAFPGDPRNLEQNKYPTAKLSDLGEKLLGLKKF